MRHLAVDAIGAPLVNEALNESLHSAVSYVDLDVAKPDEAELEEMDEEEFVKLSLSTQQKIGHLRCLILPENKWKIKWDFWLIFVLIFVAFTLPYRIAFSEDDDTTWTVINFIVDFSFVIDIMITFFTAIPDHETNGLITDKRLIAIDYLKSWFWIDLISIIPLDKMISNNSGDMLKLAKFSRFARFTRLIRFFRILRMVKMIRICRDRKRIANRTGDLIKIDENVSRLLTFLAVILFIVHVLSCLWVVAAKVNDTQNWILTYQETNFAEHPQDYEDYETYIVSFYFVSTTVTTVGYGDITGENLVEKVFCIVMLFVGVMTFSYATGSLSSIITSYDNK